MLVPNLVPVPVSVPRAQVIPGKRRFVAQVVQGRAGDHRSRFRRCVIPFFSVRAGYPDLHRVLLLLPLLLLRLLPRARRRTRGYKERGTLLVCVTPCQNTTSTWTRLDFDDAVQPQSPTFAVWHCHHNDSRHRRVTTGKDFRSTNLGWGSRAWTMAT